MALGIRNVEVVAELAGAITAARAYASQAKAQNTVRAYRTDWKAFTAWCEAKGLAALPATPETVALHLAAAADSGRKVATLGRCLASIAKAARRACVGSRTRGKR